MNHPQTVCQTQRLIIRYLDDSDAHFILQLLNTPDFIRFIGDKGVRTPDDARRYLFDGPIASYTKYGFGLFLVECKDERRPIGICGLLKRDYLYDVDLGAAFLPEWCRNGYGFEAAAAIIEYGKIVLHIDRIVAIISPGNEASVKLAQKLGLRFERLVKPPESATEVLLFTPQQP